MSVFSVGPIPVSHVLCVSVTQATTKEYFVAVVMMLQANSGVLFLCWFGFFSWLVGCFWKGNIRAEFTENRSVKITNLSDSSTGLLLVLLVLHVGGFVYATLLRIVESIEENK